jgi:hypothetical protein
MMGYTTLQPGAFVDAHHKNLSGVNLQMASIWRKVSYKRNKGQ